MEKNKESKKEKIIRIIIFSVFLAVFVVSSYKVVTKLLDDKKADDAYTSIQAIMNEAMISLPVSDEENEYYEITDTEDDKGSVISDTESTPDETTDSEKKENNQNTGSKTEDKTSESVTDNNETIKKPDKTNNAESTSKPQTQKTAIDFSKLKMLSENIVAWVRLDGTIIDYPVLQTSNNSFYLNHLYTGAYCASGSIFMDYRSLEDLSDKNTVIYGHRMQNGTMFDCIVNYSKQKFYDEHPSVTLFTPYGTYTVELIAGTTEDGNHEFVRFDFEDEADFDSYIKDIRSRSTFTSDTEVTYEDHLVTFCTCSYNMKNARYMLVGKIS